MTAVRTLALFAVLLLPAGRATADDLKDMVGTWLIEKATLGGKDIDLKDFKLKIETGGKYTASHGEEADKGTFTVDAKATPKGMEVKSAADGGGPLKGKTIPAIYDLKGDTLTICYDMELKAKPAKFESPADSQVFLVTYKREKK